MPLLIFLGLHLHHASLNIIILRCNWPPILGVRLSTNCSRIKSVSGVHLLRPCLHNSSLIRGSLWWKTGRFLWRLHIEVRYKNMFYLCSCNFFDCLADTLLYELDLLYSFLVAVFVLWSLFNASYNWNNDMFNAEESTPTWIIMCTDNLQPVWIFTFSCFIWHNLIEHGWF